MHPTGTPACRATMRPSVDNGDCHPDAHLMAGLPSDDDRLNAIRAHADRAMRYYAAAFLQETEENRDLMRRTWASPRTSSLYSIAVRSTIEARCPAERRSSSSTSSKQVPVRTSLGTAASAANVPSWLGSRVRGSGRSSAARLKYGQRRRGWHARHASRS